MNAVTHPPLHLDWPARLAQKLRIGAGGATVLLALAALAVQLLPGLADALALHRDQLPNAWWQLLTAHFAHFTHSHFAWDAATFLVLGILVERRGFAPWILLIAGSALAISLGILLFQPAITEYRGLSGIDSALFTALAIHLLCDHWRNRQPLWAAVILLALAAFAGKIAFELLCHTTLFVQDLGTGVHPVPLAHILGGIVGIACALIPNNRAAKRA